MLAVTCTVYILGNHSLSSWCCAWSVRGHSSYSVCTEKRITKVVCSSWLAFKLCGGMCTMCVEIWKVLIDVLKPSICTKVCEFVTV